MKKLYQKNELRFALLWIFIYCAVTIPIRGEYGDGSIQMFAALCLIAIGILLFVKRQGLEQKYGLCKWQEAAGNYWYFLPMAILATGNIWDGFALAFRGTSLVLSILSMFLIGFVEEMIFRGFLFRALLQKDSDRTAIIIASVTFGIGHIVNLLAGQANLTTILQVVFAIAMGFLLTMVFYASGSLLVCILVHGVINALSMVGADHVIADTVYIIISILTALVYCTYLYRRPCVLRKMPQ